MEETVKEIQAPPLVLGKSKLRYPLRSATKPKEEKPTVPEFSNSSASKRGRQESSVSRSVSLLDVSGNDESATGTRPPRRFSIPAKSLVNPSPRPAAGGGAITPISEARTKRQGKSETPLSEVSRASSRKKFSVLSSASYWLSQIKLSEAAAKHSISLGFFKLALEAGCESLFFVNNREFMFRNFLTNLYDLREPIQRMRDELSSYVSRHMLDENGEIVKELFVNYNKLDNQEQVQVSETCSQVPEEGTRSSDDEVHSSSSTVGTRKLRPRSLNADAAKVSSVKESAKKVSAQQNTTAPRTRGLVNKNSAKTKSVSNAGEHELQKKPQKQIKQEVAKEKDKAEKQRKRSPSKKGSVSPTVAPEENKENTDDSQMEEISLTEAI